MVMSPSLCKPGDYVAEPTPSQLLREAKRRLTQARNAYTAAMDLLARATEAKANAEHTADQALSAKIAAEQAFDAAVDAVREGPDEV